MDIRLTLRRLVVPVALYSVAGLVAGYFVWHGVNGQRGLKAGVEYEQRIAELRHELDALTTERGQWERKISLIRGNEVDSDLLDNEARALLGRVHRNEVVILLPPRSGSGAR